MPEGASFPFCGSDCGRGAEVPTLSGRARRDLEHRQTRSRNNRVSSKSELRAPSVRPSCRRPSSGPSMDDTHSRRIIATQLSTHTGHNQEFGPIETNIGLHSRISHGHRSETLMEQRGVFGRAPPSALAHQPGASNALVRTLAPPPQSPARAAEATPPAPAAIAETQRGGHVRVCIRDHLRRHRQRAGTKARNDR